MNKMIHFLFAAGTRWHGLASLAAIIGATIWCFPAEASEPPAVRAIQCSLRAPDLVPQSEPRDHGSRFLENRLLAVRPLFAQGANKITRSGRPEKGDRPDNVRRPAVRPQPAGTNWLLIGGIIVAVLIVLAIGLLLFRGDKKGTTHRAGGVKSTETQIDDYRLLNLMMTGQTSQVWEVSELASGRHFALKLLLDEHVHNEEQRTFLFHEAEVGRQIVHPNIIKILTIVKDRNHPYIIMEFFPSMNLKLRLMRKDELLKENFNKIIEQAATGLAYMHDRGWAHRDVKPDNILANASADVRLIDFALAQRLSTKKSRGLARKGKIMGTRSYMSPEQIRGEPLDQRADIYSFGATMYELLTFRPPFRASSPQDLLNKHIMEKPASPQQSNPELTPEISDLILRMLSKKREDRPRDFSDFLVKFRGVRIFKVQAAARKKT